MHKSEREREKGRRREREKTSNRGGALVRLKVTDEALNVPVN